MKRPQKKPWVDIEVSCPHCQSTLRVKVHRVRRGEPEPVEYDYDQRVEVLLPGLAVAHREVVSA